MNGAALISALNTANSNGEDDTISLGACTYQISSTNNTTDGSNGLPAIMPDEGTTLTISGTGTAATIITRVAKDPFRLFYVSSGAALTLSGLSITNGLARGDDGSGGDGGSALGGAIYVDGGLTLTTVLLSGNNAVGGTGGYGGSASGGAIFSTSQGTLSITDSTFSGNSAVGGAAGVRTGVSSNFSYGYSGGPAYGGAIYASNGVSISGGSFSNNSATGGVGGDISGSVTYLYGGPGGAPYGGAVYIETGESSLTNAVLQENNGIGGVGGTGPRRDGLTGSGVGGAIVTLAALSLTGCTVLTNSVDGSGGGAAVQGGATLTIDGCSFSENTASTDYGGGALLVSNSTLQLSNSTLDNNSAVLGGALASLSDGGPVSITISTSTFSNNTATDYEGGAASFSRGDMQISDSTFSGNHATGTDATGGAISSRADLQISNSTISGNSATGSGGGLLILGDTTLSHATIADNQADSDSNGVGDGGGISRDPSADGALTLDDTIVAGNFDTPSNGGTAPIQPDLSGDITSAGYNLVGDVTGSSGITNGSGGDQAGSAASRLGPLLGALQNNGGSTQTRALLDGSPALDTGDPSFAAPPANDQRGSGFDRVSNGRIDIGAFEKQAASAIPVYSSDPSSPGPIRMIGAAGTFITATVLVSNVGDTGTALSVTSASVSAGFSYLTSPNPAKMQPGDTPQALLIGCTPSAVSAQTGTLTVTTDEPGSPTYTYTLICELAAPGISITPSPLDFGTITVGQTSAVKTLTIASTGNQPLQISSLGISGMFTIVSDSGASPCASAPFALDAGSSCTVGVQFAPTSAGSQSGVFTVADNASGSPHTAQLSGIGAASTSAVAQRVFLPLVLRGGMPDLVVTDLHVSPSKTSFTAGESVEVSVTVTNQGTAPTSSGFWVDLYVNPSSTPGINQLWHELCSNTPCVGVAWPVLVTLQPGESVTLTTSTGYDTSRTFWLGWLPSGTTTLYAQADSWNTVGSVGVVSESSETNNLGTLGGLTVTGSNPPYEPWPGTSAARPSALPGYLSARPLP